MQVSLASDASAASCTVSRVSVMVGAHGRRRGRAVRRRQRQRDVVVGRAVRLLARAGAARPTRPDPTFFNTEANA